MAENDPDLEIRAAAEAPPEPEGIRFPWREILGWGAALFVVVWAVLLLPGVVHDIREKGGLEDEVTPEMPAMPREAELTPAVLELIRRGQDAEDNGRLSEARLLYWRATKLQPKCFKCILRRRVVERIITEQSVAALEKGGQYLEELRFEEAADQYQRVLFLVPDAKANYNILATKGLATARAGAKASGRPLLEKKP